VVSAPPFRYIAPLKGVNRLRHFLLIFILLFSFRAPAFTCRDVAAMAAPPFGFVFIVDPTSSGSQLAVPYMQDGIVPIYIMSDQKQSPRALKGLRPQDFMTGLPEHINNALMSGDQKRIEKALEELIPYLKAFGGTDKFFIVAGQETGVTMAERLSAKFGLPDVEPGFIRAHRSKPHMHWAVEAAGEQIIPFTLAHNAEEALQFIRRDLKGLEAVGGVIVKTGIAASGTQVYPCRTEAEVIAAVNEILANETSFGTTNRSVMVQPFVPGREFVVNSVSVHIDGKLYTVVTEVWEYIKPSPPAYGYEVLVSPSEVPKGLIEKHIKVKEALHYRSKPGHGEYFVVAEEAFPMMEAIGVKREEHGIILLGEIAARMYGAGDTDIAGASTLYGQVQGTVDIARRPEKIKAMAETAARTGVPYTLTHRSGVYNVNAPKSDRPIFANHAIWEILESKYGDKIYKKNIYTTDGMELQETHNLTDGMAQIKIRVEGDTPEAKAELQAIITDIDQMYRRGDFWRETP